MAKPLNRMTAEQREAVLEEKKWVLASLEGFIRRVGRMTGLSDDDLVQEVFLGMCKAVSDYDATRGHFRPFVTSAARNHLKVLVTASRSQKRLPPSSLVSIHGHDDTPGLSEFLEAPPMEARPEFPARLDMSWFTPKAAKVIAAIMAEGTVPRAARSLGIPVDRAKSIYYYAVRRARKNLGLDQEEV